MVGHNQHITECGSRLRGDDYISYLRPACISSRVRVSISKDLIDPSENISGVHLTEFEALKLDGYSLLYAGSYILHY